MKNHENIRVHSTTDLRILGEKMNSDLWQQLQTTHGWATTEVEGQSVVYPVGWFADDDYDDVFYAVKSPETAVKRFAKEGEWGEVDETIWISAYCYRAGLTADGTVVTWDETDWIKFAIDPEEPECVDHRGHDWREKSVIGHGGGVIFEEVCARCGCSKLTDTWAQDPTDGEQGLESVRYEEGKYAEEVAKLYGDQEDDED